jgi:methylthioribose-1-phosphate isomerase
VDETRPLLQGSRLTAWELAQAGIPHAVLPDGAAATLMYRGLVDLVLVGADRVARNGDTANKVGTYPLAIAARHHGVPLYVVAPSSSFDPSCPSGAEIPIEERGAREVTYPLGRQAAPEGSHVFNPAFDVTPAQLVTGWVTEKGILRPPFD